MTLDDDSKTRCKILIEVLIFCTVSALSILMEFGVMPEVQSIGFYCGDSKISQKYRGDTVTLKVLLFSTILLPLFTICSVESSCYGTRGSSKRAWWPQALAWYREYLSGFLIVVFLTCVAKVLVGEPRPHFLDTCRPFQALNCTSGKFIASYTCTNSEVGSVKMRDASKSFPSAHSALSVYLFIFCAWYLQRRMVGVSAVLVAWLQVVYLVWALVCCVTRVTDHRHHWWDVLAGVALGTVFGVYTVYNFCCNFQVSTYRHLHTTAKIPDKSSNHLFKGRLLSSSSDTTAQGLADVTAT
ncbi:phospholipid phosphatase homolog 1.2 homolog [Homalodisca vitripennis]|uniref:phospholipid phosphatase homolog 1.2 homolog n=1 Tax=Homalodisca vitripennis TaxID=197043 RepID=UPI001EEBB784|nr:phospholipid phosphatase homolog 1.2 homolog [Homalodisca vitripennis]